MMKKFLTLVVLVFAVCLSGCAADEEKPEPAPAAKPGAEPEVSYEQGFSGLEGSGSNTWRWMSGEGVIRLKNSGKDMKLRIVGDAPVEQFPQPPTIRIVFNGEQLDQFPGAKNIAKEYTIPAAKQGSGGFSELRIITDKTFVPHEKDPRSSDERRLGFSLHNLVWEAR